MAVIEIIYCEAVRELLPADCTECGSDKHDCCSSCHEDYEAAYDAPMDFDLPDGRVAALCCHMHTVATAHLRNTENQHV